MGGRISAEDFRSGSASGGRGRTTFANKLLKEKGVVTGIFHPGSGTAHAYRHGLKRVWTQRGGGNGDQKPSLSSYNVNCPGLDDCPVDALVKAMRDEGCRIPMDDVVLRLVAGDERWEVTRRDIVADKDDKKANWRNNLSGRSKYFVGWVPRGNEAVVEALELPTSLYKAIIKEIEKKEKALVNDGREKSLADPWKHPWGWELTYDKSKDANDMYGATMLNPKAWLTEGMKAALRGDGVDLDRLTAMSKPADIYKALEVAWCHETPLSSVVPPPEGHVPASDGVDAALGHAAEPASRVVWSCPKGHMSQERAGFCNECGARLVEGRETVGAAKEPQKNAPAGAPYPDGYAGKDGGAPVADDLPPDVGAGEPPPDEEDLPF